MRLLVIEDEPKLADYLHKGLSENGYVVDVARDGIEGRRLATHGEYDLRGMPEGITFDGKDRNVIVTQFRSLDTEAIDGELAFFSTLSTFGTAVDVTLSELAIEAFYPANAHTAMRLLSAVGAAEQ